MDDRRLSVGIPRRRLVPHPLRPLAAGVALVALFLLAALSVHYSGSSSPGRLDRALDSRITVSVGGPNGLVLWFARLGHPFLVFGLSLLLAGVMVPLRRPRAAVLATFAAPVATGTAEWVLKPLIHRTGFESALTFPSGHATGIFTVALLIAILVNHQPPLLCLLGRSIVVVVALTLAACSSVALVAAHFHYTTDTVGGACVALVTVLSLSMAIDGVADRSTSRRSGARRRVPRPLTAPE